MAKKKDLDGDTIARQVKEIMELRRVLHDCVTQPGALCLYEDNARYMKARLEYINAVAKAAARQPFFEEEK
jgi:hypothetical protein